MAVDASDKKRGVSFFKPLDIIVYALIALLIVVFSVSFIVGRQPRDAFEVLVGDSKVMEYDFDKRLYTVFDDTRVEVISETEFKITAKGGYNVLTVYPDLKDAVVTDADCPSKECKSMRLKNGSIICSPHGLTVRSKSGVGEPTVG